MKPAATKAILLLSTASGQTDAAEAYFKQLTAFMGMENCVLPMYAEIDLAIAVENMWLETDAQGHGGVWMRIAPLAERMEAVGKILGLPEHLRAYALFPYGYPAEERKQQDRWDESRIHYVD